MLSFYVLLPSHNDFNLHMNESKKSGKIFAALLVGAVLIARILAAQYNRGKDWWPSLDLPNTSRSQISEAWKGVQQGLARLKGKVSVVVGNGENVQICLDPWVPSIRGGVPQLFI